MIEESFSECYFLAFGIPPRRSDFLVQLNIPLPPMHSTVSFGGSMVFEYSQSHPYRLCMHVGVMIGNFLGNLCCL